jgi:hypothetical protein
VKHLIFPMVLLLTGCVSQSELIKLQERMDSVESSLLIQHQINTVTLEIEKEIAKRVEQVGAQCNMEGK